MIYISACALITLFASDAAASCNSEQKLACRKSAVEDNMDLLASGGQCIVRQYVQFTHMCTVTNYLPSTDYCCCVHQTLVLCCRYHQDWNHFRCVETDDIIHRFQEEGKSDLQLELIVPLVLLSLLLLVIVILCPASRLLRCRCHNSGGSSGGNRRSHFCMPAWSQSQIVSNKHPVTTSLPEDSAVQLTTMSRDFRCESQPSIQESHLSSNDDGSQTVLIPLVTKDGSSGGGTPRRREPSAPPLDDLDCRHLPNANRSGGAAMEYRVCHLAIDDDDTENRSPFVVLGCHRINNAHERCDDTQGHVTFAASRVYLAPELPPNYEEATSGVVTTAEDRSVDGDRGQCV